MSTFPVAKGWHSPTWLGLGLALMALLLPACRGNERVSSAYSNEPPKEAKQQEAATPEQMLGRTVVVNGEVAQVYSPNAFAVKGDNTFASKGTVLVLVSSSGASGTGTGGGTGGTGSVSAGTGASGTSTGTNGTGAASTDTGMGTATSGVGISTGTGTRTTALQKTDLRQGETVQFTGEVHRFTPEALSSQYGISLDEALLSQLQQAYAGKPILITSSVDQLPPEVTNKSRESVNTSGSGQ